MEILKWLIGSLIGGFLFVLCGFCMMRWLLANPQLKNVSFRPDVSGWASAIGFTIIGLVILIKKLVLWIDNLIK